MHVPDMERVRVVVDRREPDISAGSSHGNAKGATGWPGIDLEHGQSRRRGRWALVAIGSVSMGGMARDIGSRDAPAAPRSGYVLRAQSVFAKQAPHRGRQLRTGRHHFWRRARRSGRGRPPSSSTTGLPAIRPCRSHMAVSSPASARQR